MKVTIGKTKISGMELELVWRVFSEYEAADYSEAGKEMFYRSIHDASYLNQLCAYGAYQGDDLLGIIATRSNNSHIALYFVDGKYHGKGIGRALFEAARADCSGEKMTVHSSRFAVPVYKKLGFVPTDSEQLESGIIFTPMELELK